MGNLYLYHFAKQAFCQVSFTKYTQEQNVTWQVFSFLPNKLIDFPPYMVYSPKTFLKNLFEMLIN